MGKRGPSFPSPLHHFFFENLRALKLKNGIKNSFCVGIHPPRSSSSLAVTQVNWMATNDMILSLLFFFKTNYHSGFDSNGGAQQIPANKKLFFFIFGGRTFVIKSGSTLTPTYRNTFFFLSSSANLFIHIPISVFCFETHDIYFPS